MRTASLLAGGVLLAAIASHTQAAIDISFIQTRVDSSWAAQIGTDTNATAGTPDTKTFNVFTEGAFPGSYTHNGTSSIAEPHDLAFGQGSIDADVTTSAFSFAGSGYGEAEWDSVSGADVLYGQGSARVVLNFVVPAGGPDQYLTLNGSAHADAWTSLMVRLAESNDGGQTVNYPIDVLLDANQTTDSDYNWTNAQYTLKAGYAYALDLYADTEYAAWADTMYPEFWSATSSFTLTGSVVPEPGVILTMLGVVLGGLSLRRRFDGQAWRQSRPSPDAAH